VRQEAQGRGPRRRGGVARKGLEGGAGEASGRKAGSRAFTSALLVKEELKSCLGDPSPPCKCRGRRRVV